MPVIRSAPQRGQLNNRPFLSIVTRTCKRPKALKICQKSLADQTCQDFEHIIIVDEVGRGVAWANGMMAERDWSDLNGQYVYILDDDNIMLPGAIEAIKASAPDHDMVICRINRLKRVHRVFPEDAYWQKKPKYRHIDIGCVVLRRDLFLKAVKRFTARYEGDFDFISEAYFLAESVNWRSRLIMKLQRISAGTTEHE